MRSAKWMLFVTLGFQSFASAGILERDAYAVIGQVFLNGAGPFRFIIDTGAESTTISAKLATKLSLRPTYRVEVDSVNGTKFTPAAIVTCVNAGNMTAYNVEVLWHDFTVEGIDGILGQSFLGRFRLLLDYEKEQVIFEPAQEPDGGIRLPVERLAGRPAVHAGALRLILDSGAPRLILFKTAPGRTGQRVPVAGGLPGLPPVQGDSGVLPRLTLGDLVLLNVPYVFISNPSRNEDGLLPLSLFSWVYLDPYSDVAAVSARVTARK
jgi:hypothetical protein